MIVDQMSVCCVCLPDNVESTSFPEITIVVQPHLFAAMFLEPDSDQGRMHLFLQVCRDLVKIILTPK